MKIIPDILFEDNHLLAVNKPAGTLVQGDKTGDTSLLESIKSFLKTRDNKPGNVFLGTIHRLDRPVSGVCIFAKTSKSLKRMNDLFRKRQIQKTYWAITLGKPVPESGTLVHYIVKDGTRNVVTAFHHQKDGSVRAELQYSLLEQQKAGNLLEVLPLTGRPHQIRVQLSAIDCPIVGDLKYGASFPNKDKSICLHARQLSFTHPVKDTAISIRAPLPSLPVWSFFG